jgi:soluble lytic murein transglycosylase
MRTRTGFCLIVLAALVAAGVPARAQAPKQQAAKQPAPVGDAAVLKQAIDLIQAGKGTEGLQRATALRDPIARKLVDWVALRLTADSVGFDRAAAFLRDSPDWPSIGLIRRRVEGLLYHARREPAFVRAYFGHQRPVSGEGKLALARALLALGDKNGAQNLVRSAWHRDDFPASIENETLVNFPGMLGRDDHKARADLLFHQEKAESGLRAAERGGSDIAAMARARAGALKRAGNTGALLNGVPNALQKDPMALFARVQYFRMRDDYTHAARAFLEAPRDPALLGDTDDWWREGRLIVRKMLDAGDAKTAYRVAVHAGLPESENYKADQQFTAGWVALRYLKDPASAIKHFSNFESFSKHPVTLGRGYYWLGRAHETANQRQAAQQAYERAARFTTTYYGQLARARLGMKDLPLHRPLEPTAQDRAAFARNEPVQALKLLYAADERNLTIPFYVDYAERLKDEAAFLLLGAIAYDNRDPRGMVLVGKTAYQNGIQLDTIAYPVFGIPDIPASNPPVDKALVYAIARQESQFYQGAESTAKAYGLMQVIQSTARNIAKRMGLGFDLNKLRTDPHYNARLGANELGTLLQDYRGSYILTFIGYNAGPGRARQWIAAYGDPRDPNVDVVDWVERIPISETRFYIQRVMENMQVYKVLFGSERGLMIEADITRGRG